MCYWEDDPVQYDDPDYEGGANAVSLRQAQQNFLRSGVSNERFRRHARKPTAHDEMKRILTGARFRKQRRRHPRIGAPARG
jgi:hypothetical protein